MEIDEPRMRLALKMTSFNNCGTLLIYLIICITTVLTLRNFIKTTDYNII